MAKAFLKLFVVIFSLALYSGCERDYDGYYEIPIDLSGPLYEQLKANPDYSQYVDALEKVPELPNIINTSGLYTVFVPNNTAWNNYLSDKGYGSNSDIPAQELQELVENHILFSMWFRYDFDRFISDSETSYSDVTSFEVRSRPDVRDVKASIGSLSNDIGSAVEGDDVKVYHDYRQAKVYVDDYLEKLSHRADYEIIYGKTSSDFIFGGANVISTEEVDAKNGVIHEIDQVVEPADLLSDYMQENESTSLFYDIAETFMELDYSEDISETYGHEVYELSFVYPGSINYTNTTNVYGSSRDTWTGRFRYAYETDETTVFLPTNESLKEFLESKYIESVDDINEIPVLGRFYTLSGSTVRYRSYWPTDIDELSTMTGDTIFNADVFGDNDPKMTVLSNGLIYEGDFIPSRKLTSVTAKAILDKDYDWTGVAMLNVQAAEEASGGSSGAQLINVFSDSSLADDGKFTFLTPNNTAWENYGFTMEDFNIITPEGSIMNDMTSPKMWGILKTHALLGAFDPQDLEDGTLANGYYLTASRLYLKYENGTILGYNRDQNKVDSYIPNLVSVEVGSSQVEDNGVVVGVDGIIDLHINKDNNFFTLTEDKKALSDLSYKPFMDKCNAVFLFEDGEIDYKDDFLVQNLTVFVPSEAAIQAHDQVIGAQFSALPNKAELDSVKWTNVEWQKTLKGHFVWDAQEPLKRIFIDTDEFAGGEKYYTSGTTFYRNNKIEISYANETAYVNSVGSNVKIAIGKTVDGNSMATDNTRAINEQCMNGVVHLVDQIIPLQ